MVIVTWIVALALPVAYVLLRLPRFLRYRMMPPMPEFSDSIVRCIKAFDLAKAVKMCSRFSGTAYADAVRDMVKLTHGGKFTEREQLTLDADKDAKENRIDDDTTDSFVLALHLGFIGLPLVAALFAHRLGVPPLPLYISVIVTSGVAAVVSAARVRWRWHMTLLPVELDRIVRALRRRDSVIAEENAKKAGMEGVALN